VRADIRIYRGLISEYTAKLAAFARKEKLDTMSVMSGYYEQFFWVEGNLVIEIYCQLGGSKLAS
jgi:hypothetical protein